MSDDLIEAIKTFTVRRGYPPSRRELAEQFGVAIGTIQKWIEDAEKEGRLVKEPGARAIRIVEGET